MESKKKLRIARQEDDAAINVVHSNMTLDEWFDKWISICKKNCRDNTKDTYTRHYKRVKDALGWRKLNKLNLMVCRMLLIIWKQITKEKIVKKFWLICLKRHMHQI